MESKALLQVTNITQTEKFRHRGYWKNRENHRIFFDRSKDKLGYNCMEDWYNITQEDICRNGGITLLFKHYNSSPSMALQKVYPEHNWMLWRFKVVPTGYWDEILDNPVESKRLVDWLGEQLHIKGLDDWNRVSLDQMNQWVKI